MSYDQNEKEFRPSRRKMKEFKSKDKDKDKEKEKR